METNPLIIIKDSISTRLNIKLSSIFMITEDCELLRSLSDAIEKVKAGVDPDIPDDILILFEQTLAEMGIDRYFPYDEEAVVIMTVGGDCVVALCYETEIKLLMCADLIKLAEECGEKAVLPFCHYIAHGFDSIHKIIRYRKFKKIGSEVDNVLAHCKPLPHPPVLFDDDFYYDEYNDEDYDEGEML